MKTILKATSKGQITLPAAWRKRVKTDQFLVQEKSGSLEIIPLDMKKVAKKENWMTIFDADRDNNGKPISGRSLVKAIEKRYKK